jgi:hypothetical protein
MEFLRARVLEQVFYHRDLSGVYLPPEPRRPLPWFFCPQFPDYKMAAGGRKCKLNGHYPTT